MRVVKFVANSLRLVSDDRHGITILAFLGFWLRIHRLGDKSVWWDEGWSVWVARQNFMGILQKTGTDVHPPLYFALLHAWRWFSGDSEFGLRLLAAVLGTLTIPAIYLLGRTVGGKKTGLLAAVFITFSRFNIAWSQEIRMYALASLLAVLGVWAAIQVWERGRWQDYVAYILCMTAGLYTLYLFFPIPVAVNVAWLWIAWQTRTQKRTWWPWLAAQGTVLVLLALWLSYALRGFLTTSSATPISVWEFLKTYWTVLVVGIPLNVDAYVPVTLPALLVFGIGLAVLIHAARHSRRHARHITLLLTGLLTPVAIVYYIAIPKAGAYAPPFAPRYLVIFSGYYAILLAWGMVELGNGRFRSKPLHFLTPLLTLVILYAAYVGLRDYHAGRVRLDDYASLARTLTIYEQPQDAVLLFTDTDWPVWAYHHPGDWQGVPHAWQITPEQANDYLTPIWETHDGLWLVVTPYAGISDPQNNLINWLAERAAAVSTQSYGDKALRFYARTPQRAANMDQMSTAVHPQFAETAVLTLGTSLLGYDQAVHDYRSGDIAYLGLYWQTDGHTSGAELGIVNQDHTFDAEVPLTMPTTTNNSEPTRQTATIHIPPEAPSGRYRFYLLDDSSHRVEFGSLQIQQRYGDVLQPNDVTIANRLDATFGDQVRLLGYNIETEQPQPGGTVYLTLYWQAQAPILQQYKVFTHLLGDVFNAETENFLWGQQDNEPVNGSRPTTSWRTGEVIIDAYAIPIAAHAPDGSYRIEIGLYEPASGARLPLLGEDGKTAVSDHLILTTITIKQK